MDQKSPPDALEELLLASKPSIVHQEFLQLYEKWMYIYESSKSRPSPLVEQGYCDHKMIPIPLLTWMDILARNSMTEAGRPDLQIIDELFMIFLYMYLHEPYRVHWLYRPGVRPLRLMKLIRAANVVIEAIDLRYASTDNQYRRFAFSLPGGIGQGVQILRQVYLMGCMIGNDNQCGNMEQVIALHEVPDAHRIEIAFPFRALLAKCPLDQHVFPFEQRVFIGDLSKTDLMASLWNVAPAIPKYATQFAKWDASLALSFLHEKRPDTTESFLHQGRRFYVDPRDTDNVNPLMHDRLYGRGEFALLVKRLRVVQLRTS
jgi:hypothetical protein